MKSFKEFVTEGFQHNVDHMNGARVEVASQTHYEDQAKFKKDLASISSKVLGDEVDSNSNSKFEWYTTDAGAIFAYWDKQKKYGLLQTKGQQLLNSQKQPVKIK